VLEWGTTENLKFQTAWLSSTQSSFVRPAYHSLKTPLSPWHNHTCAFLTHPSCQQYVASRHSAQTFFWAAATPTSQPSHTNLQDADEYPVVARPDTFPHLIKHRVIIFLSPPAKGSRGNPSHSTFFLGRTASFQRFHHQSTVWAKTHRPTSYHR
jgi:hypothetical protein